MRKLIIAVAVVACSLSYGATYYISQGATGTYDGSTLLTGFTNIYDADETINYADNDIIYVDAGTNGDNIGYVYSGGPGDEWRQSRFFQLTCATNANGITIEGINGIPKIVAQFAPLSLKGVRYNFTIKRLFMCAYGGATIEILNPRENVDMLGAPASLYPDAKANNVIEGCIISNSSNVAGIRVGDGGVEDDITNTVARGTLIVSNLIVNTSTVDGTVDGGIWIDPRHGYGVSVTYNEIVGAGATVPGNKKGFNTSWHGTKYTNFFLAHNNVHDWRMNGLYCNFGSSEVRENLIWNIGEEAIVANGGVAGGVPNHYVNNTMYNVSIAGNDKFTYSVYDPDATNWWINNLYVSNNNPNGCIHYSHNYGEWWNYGPYDLFDPNMSYLGGASTLVGNHNEEKGTNYWNEDPRFISTVPSDAGFLAPNMVAGNPAVNCGTNLFGGKSYIGAVLPLPEPALLLGIVMLAACLWRR